METIEVRLQTKLLGESVKGIPWIFIQDTLQVPTSVILFIQGELPPQFDYRLVTIKIIMASILKDCV